MSRKVVCPGSFDPITVGHLDIFTRAAAQYDEVVVAVVYNPDKNGTFTPDERMDLIRGATTHLPNVSVAKWTGLLVDFAKQEGIKGIVKGLRSAKDFDYETSMAQMNFHLAGVDTIFFLTDPSLSYVSSSLVKQVAGLGGDVKDLLPANVYGPLMEKLGR